MKANETFRKELEAGIALLITDAKQMQSRIEEMTKGAIAFAVAHGRTEYLNRLVLGLPANMAKTVSDYVEAFNRKAVATMVKGLEQSKILSVIDNDVDRAAGRVVMLAKRGGEFVINKDNDASKVARRILGETFESEEAFVTAMGAISEAATKTANQRRDAEFNESDAAVRFMVNHVKKIAGSGKEGAAEHAFQVGVTLNSIIPDGGKRKSENDLKTIIAGALIANDQPLSEEYRKALPTVPGIVPEPEVIEPPVQEVRRGRRANG